MINTTYLQAILLANGEDIICHIHPKQVARYHYLKEMLESENVAEHPIFQQTLAHIHPFDPKHPPATTQKRFFYLLEKYKHKTHLDMLKISKKLFKQDSKTSKSKQFSLLSRLMHTIHENYPIYDPNVNQLFEYTPPEKELPGSFRKFSAFFRFYHYQFKLYKEVLKKDKLNDLFQAINLRFHSHHRVLNRAKCLDLAVRSAGALKSKGRLINPTHHIFPV